MSGTDQLDVLTTRLLDSLWPGLPREFPGLADETLRLMSARLASEAVESAGLGDNPILQHALQSLLDSHVGRPSISTAVAGLVQELDEAAWALQAKAEQLHTSEEDYVRLLQETGYARAARKATAAETVACALDPDALAAATSAIYTANASIGNMNQVRRVVADVLDEPKRHLEALSSGLPERLGAANEERLRRAAMAAARLAIMSVPLGDPRLERALAALENENAEREAALEDVKALVQELDDLIFNSRQLSDVIPAKRQEYLEAFARGRAAAAVGSAMDPDPLSAATWAIYEASQAIRDLDSLRHAVEQALST